MNHMKQLVKDKLGLSVFPTQSIETHLKAAADWILQAQLGTADDGVAIIYVDADTPGVTQGPPYRKAGMAADANGDIWFEEARVPLANRAHGPGADAGKGCTQRIDVCVEKGRVQIAADALRA